MLYYTNEKNCQVVISLLKSHNIKKIIISPGATNITFVASVQQDSFFEIYSSVDERSAAYLACGLAEETNEPVALSCTGATSSRNYLPGLTEAFYRKLPILAITSSQANCKVGHLFAQVTDRAHPPIDSVKLSVSLPIIKDAEDLWECEMKVNQAILELNRHGGGPVHINLPTTYSKDYSIKTLPSYRVINRITQKDEFPTLNKKKIGIWVGSHKPMNSNLTKAIDQFCEKNNAVVFCDHTSGYKGKYRLLFALVAGQKTLDKAPFIPDLMIHIGEISGDYSNYQIPSRTEVWRVNEDGEIRDTFKKLRYIFEMPEEFFFMHYSNQSQAQKNDFFETCSNKLLELRNKIPELPYSNIWIASKLANLIPNNSVVQLSILNTLRSWNYFEFHESVSSFSNVGGFGIDGNLSSLIGASFANENKLYFSIIGDLSFFYDMNVLGNRHINNNIRILLINNGKGMEFRVKGHVAEQFGDEADKYIAAAGHFGNQSCDLVKHYAKDLGFEYLSAKNKNEFNLLKEQFVSAKHTSKPILFEVFTHTEDEKNALEMIGNIETDFKTIIKNNQKSFVDNAKNKVKKIIERF